MFYRSFTAILASLLLLAACDDFLGVRDPEPPIRTNPLHWTPATSPQILLTNMANAFQYREYETYMHCLADTTQSGQSYQFIPSAQSKVLYPGRFDGWNLSSELNYFQNFLSAVPADSQLYLILTEEEPYSETGDTLNCQLLYEIRAGHTRSGIHREFQGRLTWRLVKNAANYWVICRWDDESLHQFSGWSELKALF
ncbi:MAG TPA: hypothetical protein ENN84_08065 [Candidatus Marinimicrobia bacterium]|nr:hypothetical protein [Candidatus Neomarinimicrobiota bacterium]